MNQNGRNNALTGTCWGLFIILISFSPGRRDFELFFFYVRAVSVMGLCEAAGSVCAGLSGSPVSVARSCPVNCINMKFRCIIDEATATFTVGARAPIGRIMPARVRE